MDKHDHLWIPEGEVVEIEYKPTGREKEIPVDFSEHGIELLNELNTIEEIYTQKERKTTSGYIIFKARLHDSQKFSSKKRQKFLENKGLELKYIKNNNEAIIASKPRKFEMLKTKVKDYQKRNRNLGFQYIESFNFIKTNEKQSSHLKKRKDFKDEEKIDIQIQLLPNFSESIYSDCIKNIEEVIIDSNGKIIDEPYYLSDNTPLVRAKVDSSTIDLLANDDMILRIEETNFFSTDDSRDEYDSFESIPIHEEIVLDELPTIAILDSGINFGNSPLNDFVIHTWSPDDITHTNTYHGTGCASSAMFGEKLGEQIESGKLIPKVKIVSGIISDGSSLIPFKTFLERIKKAVHNLKPYTNIFNLSFNSRNPIDDDSISILAYELDQLMQEEDIQFIISSGNHDLFTIHENLNDVIDDDDARLSAPADSFLGITVGAHCLENISESISNKYEISPYSRIGFGLGGIQKPDLVAYGGNVYWDSEENKQINPPNDSTLIPTRNGKICFDCGTSFAAPIIAGNYAIIHDNLPDDIENKNLLTKALLIHNSYYPFDISDLDLEERENLRKVYGNGILNLEDSLNSNNNKVTFVRVGSLDYYTKKRVKFFMPTNIANESGNRTCKVTVTCLSQVPFHKDKGAEYSSAYVSASLKKIDTKEQLSLGNPTPSEGRYKWEPYQTFSNIFSKFNPGDWQIWLQMWRRWDLEDEYNLNYALVVTIEDLNKNNDIYTAIQSEAQNRFQPINQIRLRV